MNMLQCAQLHSANQRYFAANLQTKQCCKTVLRDTEVIQDKCCQRLYVAESYTQKINSKQNEN
jgi:hypothetical protein